MKELIGKEFNLRFAVTRHGWVAAFARGTDGSSVMFTGVNEPGVYHVRVVGLSKSGKSLRVRIIKRADVAIDALHERYAETDPDYPGRPADVILRDTTWYSRDKNKNTYVWGLTPLPSPSDVLTAARKDAVNARRRRVKELEEWTRRNFGKILFSAPIPAVIKSDEALESAKVAVRDWYRRWHPELEV